MQVPNDTTTSLWAKNGPADSNYRFGIGGTDANYADYWNKIYAKSKTSTQQKNSNNTSSNSTTSGNSNNATTANNNGSNSNNANTTANNTNGNNSSNGTTNNNNGQ